MGFVVRLRISDKFEFDIIPLNQNNKVPSLSHLNALEKIDFKKRLDLLSKINCDDEKIVAAFDSYCISVKEMYDAFFEPNFGKSENSLRVRGLFPKLMNKRK
jgi:poly-gamma-glutamate synthesis protein (capsule biosynthesis protein)